MSCVDDLLHEVAHRRIACYGASYQNAIGSLRFQLIFETLEAGLRRGMADFVLITGECHPFLQVTQPLGDLWAILYRDRWMIQR